MTQREKDLNVKVTPLVEDIFFFLLALAGEISGEQGMKVLDRIIGKWTKEEYFDAIITAEKMLVNKYKYGVACAEWA